MIAMCVSRVTDLPDPTPKVTRHLMATASTTLLLLLAWVACASAFNAMSLAPSCASAFHAMPLAPPLGQSRRAAPTLATAASEADDTVPMEDHAKAMLAAGRALLRPIVDQVRRADETGDDALLPAPVDFQEAYNAFRLAQVMDPANAEAEKELKRIDVLMKTLMDETVVEDDAVASDSSMSATVVRGEELQDEDLDAAPAPRSDTDADVVIVGAGAAGIGQAVSLIHTFGLDASRVKILERGEAIGTSFQLCASNGLVASLDRREQGRLHLFTYR